MGQPAARQTDMTATGCPVTGPSVPTVMISKMPAAVIGDLVSGAVMIGAVTKGSATVMIGKRPAARIGDLVTGAHAQTGVPLTQSLSYPGAPTVMIGG